MDMSNGNDYVNERNAVSVCRGYVHVVEPGDTLYKLARKYDVRLFDIMRLNPYVNVYNLQVGDEICIPTVAPRNERTYVVNEGDNISKILDTFGVDFGTLAGWNSTLMEVELPEGLMLRMPIEMEQNDGMIKNTRPGSDRSLQGGEEIRENESFE